MFSNFRIQIESFISEYIYAEGQQCSGRQLGSEHSLQRAQTECDRDKECVCIDDLHCDGGYWTVFSGQSTASNSYCSWTKQGIILIQLFEQRSLKIYSLND